MVVLVDLQISCTQTQTLSNLFLFAPLVNYINYQGARGGRRGVQPHAD